MAQRYIKRHNGTTAQRLNGWFKKTITFVMTGMCMKRLVLTFINLILFCVILSAQSSEPTKYYSLEPYDFHLTWLRTDSALMIDVREHFEFRGKKIRDAINIPSSGNLEYAADTIDKNYSLFFYCTTDFRSRRVAEYFHDQGFRKVYNLEGGIVAWKRDGFPVTRRNKKKK
jgi:rhodanese-related sulfurtransferase